MDLLRQRLFALGIIPVIALDDANDAIPLCNALIQGGLPLAEITFRTNAAEEAIRSARQNFPAMLVGAGTVTSVPMAEKARAAGSMFIVTPGFNPEVAGWCIKEHVPVFPGCTTASEVEAAMNLGLGVVKFFPAEQSGGLAKITALNGPYPAMRFMPTGGIDVTNLASYLACPAVVACGGSFMVPKDLLRAKDWNGIRRLAGEAVAAALGAEIVYAGPLCPDSEFDAAARLFGRIMRRDPVIQQDRAVAGPLRVGKKSGERSFLIGLSVPSVARAKAYYEEQGFAFEPSGVQNDASGEIIKLRLQNSPAGCCIDILKR